MKKRELIMGVYVCLRSLAYCCIPILFFSYSYAQRCGSYKYFQKHPVKNILSDNIISERNSSATRDTLPNEVITIPVVIHVIYNNNIQNISDEQILSQVQSLNNDYRRLNEDAANTPAPFASVAADTRIIFSLAKFDAFGKPTTGIIRKYSKTQSWTADDGMKFSAQGGDDTWDSKKYLNIWVCNLSGSSLGYATVPGSEADKDGVVLQYTSFGTVGTLTYPFNKGRTATHEIGHWLGLRHLWGDEDCGDDGIADTPPQQTYNEGCNIFPHMSACSANHNGDMFMNFMDFTDDGCMNMFTRDQSLKMRGQFAIGGSRNSFLTAPSNVAAKSGSEINPKGEADFSVFPNPSARFIVIQSTSKDNILNKTFAIFSLSGKEIFSGTLLSQRNTISTDQLPTGMYMIKINGESSPLRFMKQ